MKVFPGRTEICKIWKSAKWKSFIAEFTLGTIYSRWYLNDIRIKFRYAKLIFQCQIYRICTAYVAAVTLSLELDQRNFFVGRSVQTWNLSKILHSQIFRLKVLHRKSAWFATFFSQINSVNASNINNLGILWLKMS